MRNLMNKIKKFFLVIVLLLGTNLVRPFFLISGNEDAPLDQDATVNNGVVIATGTVGEESDILGAPWTLYDDGTVIVLGGIAQTTVSPWHHHRELVSRIVFTEPVTGILSLKGMFRDLPNLTEIQGIENLDTSAVINMDSMFRELPNLISLDLTTFNTSSVTTMQKMFMDSTSLVHLNVSNWNTSNVTNMYNIFFNTPSLVDLDVSNWDTSGVTDADDVDGVIEQDNRIYETQEIIPLACDGVVIATGDMGSITAANSPTGVLIPGAIWSLCDCGVMIIAGGGIQMPDNTNTLIQSRFPAAIRPLVKQVVFTEPITAGTSLQCLFHGLTNLTEIVGIDYIDTTITRNFRRMFMDTESLVELDLSNFYTGSATNKYRMFMDTGAQTLNLGGIFNTGGHVANYGSMFWGASNLTSIGDTSNWNTSSATRMSRMFQATHNLAYIDTSNWHTGNVTFMYNMFNGARSLTSLDLLGWDVSNVTRMESMFSATFSLPGLDLSTWYTPSLVRIDNMFDLRPLDGLTSSLKYLHLDNFYTSNIMNRNNAFSGLTTLRVLTLGSDWYWNIFNLTGLPNPPNNENYIGLWQNVADGTIDFPQGEHLKSANQLLNNELHPDNIANIWVWAPRLPMVTFEAPNGALTPPNVSITVPNGTTIGDITPLATIPSAIPNDPNYEFSHWVSSDNSHPDEINTVDLQDLVITQDTVFTAVFTRVNLTVTFDALGGTLTPSDVSIRVPHSNTVGSVTSSATIPIATPNNLSYEFSHWISSDDSHPDEINTVDLKDLVITEDTVFTAVFARVNLTVTFEAPDGTLTPSDVSIRVPHSNTVGSVTPSATIPIATPNNLSYEFSHWISSDNSHPDEINTVYLQDLVITEDTVFTAVFRFVYVPILGIYENDYPFILLSISIIGLLMMVIINNEIRKKRGFQRNVKQ